MDRHLSDDEIERYLDENALASDHARVHDHMAACAACAETWREIVAAQDALVAHELETAEPLVDAQTETDTTPTPRDDDRIRRTMIRAAVLLLVASLGAAISRAVVDWMGRAQ